MQLHLGAEQNTNVTFASFGLVSLVLDESSEGVSWLEETARVLVFLRSDIFQKCFTKNKIDG